MKKNEKIIVIVVLVLAMIPIILFARSLFLMNQDDKRNENNISQEQKRNNSNQQIANTITEEEKIKIAEEEKAKKMEELKNQLQREIDDLKNFDNSKYKTSIELINVEIAFLSVWADMINEAMESDNQEVNNLGKQLEQSVKQFQIKEFPIMRKEYGKLINNILWEHNIEVKVFGSYNNTIELVGAYFADNANIKETQMEMQKMLKSLRFDKINYKWYEYDRKYPYYKLESYADSVIVGIK